MSVTRFTLAYPSASNAFQNRLRTEFNNKRAAHFEIDLSRPFSRRVSLSLFPPLDLAGERWWDGFIPFLPFWKTRRAAISKYSPFAFEINLSSEFAFTFPRSFDEANAFESVVRSAMKRYVRDVFILSYRGIIPSRENDSRMIGVKERS